MDSLQHLATALSEAKSQQIEILQQINAKLLTHYRIKITSGLCIYPLEVEAYYNNGHDFNDCSCHCHRLQQNRFGKLYFHRLGQTGTLNKTRGGVDICLSDQENIYFSLLIRSARIGKESITGPHKVAEKIIQEARQSYDKLEQYEVLEPYGSDSIRQETIFQGTRVNLGKNVSPRYREMNLRSLIQLHAHPFKEKEKILHSHIQNLKRRGAGDPEEQIKTWLGYKSKTLSEELKSIPVDISSK